MSEVGVAASPAASVAVGDAGSAVAVSVATGVMSPVWVTSVSDGVAIGESPPAMGTSVAVAAAVAVPEMGSIVVPKAAGVVVVMAGPVDGAMVALGSGVSAVVSDGVSTVAEAIAPGMVWVAGCCELSGSPGVGDGVSPPAFPPTVVVGGYPTDTTGPVANDGGGAGSDSLPPDGPTSGPGGVGGGGGAPVDTPGVGEGDAGVPTTWVVPVCPPLPVPPGCAVAAIPIAEVLVGGAGGVLEAAGGEPVATPPEEVAGVAAEVWEGNIVALPTACTVGEAAPENPPDDTTRLPVVRPI